MVGREGESHRSTLEVQPRKGDKRYRNFMSNPLTPWQGHALITVSVLAWRKAVIKFSLPDRFLALSRLERIICPTVWGVLPGSHSSICLPRVPPRVQPRPPAALLARMLLWVILKSNEQNIMKPDKRHFRQPRWMWRGIRSYIGFTRCNVLWRMPGSQLNSCSLPVVVWPASTVPQPIITASHRIPASRHIILCFRTQTSLHCCMYRVLARFRGYLRGPLPGGGSHSIINNHNSNLLPLYCSLILFMAMISSVLFVS